MKSMKSAALFFEKNRERTVEILLFFILIVNYSYFLPKWADWSQNSRMDLILAIVDQGSLAIDDYYKNTGDYAYFEGHYYLDKAPGPTFLAVPVYAAVAPSCSPRRCSMYSSVWPASRLLPIH
jgi:hypothetical protein